MVVRAVTPLHEAARSGHKDVVKLLIHAGAAPMTHEDKDRNGN